MNRREFLKRAALTTAAVPVLAIAGGIGLDGLTPYRTHMRFVPKFQDAGLRSLAESMRRTKRTIAYQVFNEVYGPSDRGPGGLTELLDRSPLVLGERGAFEESDPVGNYKHKELAIGFSIGSPEAHQS